MWLTQRVYLSLALVVTLAPALPPAIVVVVAVTAVAPFVVAVDLVRDRLPAVARLRPVAALLPPDVALPALAPPLAAAAVADHEKSAAADLSLAHHQDRKVVATLAPHPSVTTP